MRNQFGGNSFQNERDTLQAAVHWYCYGDDRPIRPVDALDLREHLLDAAKHATGNDLTIIHALQGLSDLDLYYLQESCARDAESDLEPFRLVIASELQAMDYDARGFFSIDANTIYTREDVPADLLNCGGTGDMSSNVSAFLERYDMRVSDEVFDYLVNEIGVESDDRDYLTRFAIWQLACDLVEHGESYFGI